MEVNRCHEAGELGEPADPALHSLREQHHELRRIITAGLEQVRGPFGPRRSFRGDLSQTIRRLGALLARHLADEESIVLPALERDGGHRADLLRAEHARQRRALDELCAWVIGDAEIELAAGFRRLAYALLEDIEGEDRTLLTPEGLRRASVLGKDDVASWDSGSATRGPTAA